MKKSRDIIKVDFSFTPAFIMDLCYAARGTRARSGNRMAQRLRNEWSLHPVAEKLIADFDAGRLRRGRGQPKGFLHERLLERDRFIIAYVEHARQQLANRGVLNSLKKACDLVDHYFNKTGPYRNRSGDVYYDQTGSRFKYAQIKTVMRRHITRRNAEIRNNTSRRLKP